MVLKLGIISDTHGLLRPEAVTALAGVDRILHAGDIGSEAVLEGLGQIAPVDAVRGNIDISGPCADLPEHLVVQAGRARIYLVHEIQHAGAGAVRGCHAVIYGHSHKPEQQVRNGVLYLNPGAAGPRRFRLPVAVSILTVEGTRLQATSIRLDPAIKP